MTERCLSLSRPFHAGLSVDKSAPSIASTSARPERRPVHTRAISWARCGTCRRKRSSSNPEVLTLWHNEWVAAVALAADGLTLATASGNRFEPSGHTVRLWDAATGRKRGIGRA